MHNTSKKLSVRTSILLNGSYLVSICTLRSMQPIVRTRVWSRFILPFFPLLHMGIAHHQQLVLALYLLCTSMWPSLSVSLLSRQYCQSCSCVSGQSHQWNPGLLFALFALYKIIVSQLLFGHRFCEFRIIVQPFCISQNHSSNTNLYHKVVWSELQLSVIISSLLLVWHVHFGPCEPTKSWALSNLISL